MLGKQESAKPALDNDWPSGCSKVIRCVHVLQYKQSKALHCSALLDPVLNAQVY